jgi:2-polyprenyl-3-methyl-5-hydroxy-6-metoxy-1,4-benzoquinol methylase
VATETLRRHHQNQRRHELRRLSMSAFTADPYEALRPLMNRYGATCSPREFYWAVNQAYEAVEAHQQEELAMFVGLEPIWDFLLGQAAGHSNPKLRVLEVGAGSGLIAGFVEMHLADRVTAMTLLAPCEATLDQCRRRADLLSFPCDFRHGDLLELGSQEQFDVIAVNSVLQRAADLPAFFARVSTLLSPRGWLLTAHDPRWLAESDEQLKARHRTWQKRHRQLGREIWARCCQAWQRLTGRPGLSPLALGTSHHLLQQRTIREPMSMASIHAVTEFHVPGRLDGRRALAVGAMKEWLPGFTLVEVRSYQFYGVPWTALDREEQGREAQWWRQRDTHGEFFASAWRRDLQP